MYMKTKIVYSNQYQHGGDKAGEGNTEVYHYTCPWGHGIIVEEYVNTPGFFNHVVWIRCDKCKEKYELITVHSTQSWDVIEKQQESILE